MTLKALYAAALILGASFAPRAARDVSAVYVWSGRVVPQGPLAPKVVPSGKRRALEFAAGRKTRLDLGQGEDGRLRLTSALTLAAVVRLNAPPAGKVSLISKWRTIPQGRSYELGVTPWRRLFFTISASGSWPREARELLSTHTLKPGEPCLVVAVFHPGKKMAIYINGVLSAETADGVPGRIHDSDTPVWLGNRPGSEAACAFDGWIGPVWIHGAALDARAIQRLARRLELTGAPGPTFRPLRPPYDLDAVRDRVRAWYDILEATGQPYGAYRLTPATPPDLYASADIAWIRWIMNDLDLTKKQRSEWIRFIQDQQSAGDGSYRHRTGHCKTHAFCHATGALNMLGGRQRHAPRLLESYLDVAGVPAWLSSIDWVNQWGGAHDIWGAGVPLVASPRTPAAWKEAVFQWLDGAVDPGTGFWRKGVKARSRLEYLGGAFHIWPLYAIDGRSLPYPDRVIDSVLKLQRPDGSFDGGFGYGNMDGVWVLQYLAARTDHRHADVVAALESNLRGLMDVYNGAPGRFLANAHGTESRIATLAILQAALPERFTSAKPSKPWRNPWHRRELFVVR